jgi:hypothetical protein
MSHSNLNSPLPKIWTASALNEGSFLGGPLGAVVPQISEHNRYETSNRGLEIDQVYPVVTLNRPTSAIIDEEGFSDDDEEDDYNPWLFASRQAQPALPISLRHHRVAKTGIFSPQVDGNIEKEIKLRGGVYVEKVDADTTVLLSPHCFARSKKAHAARMLGIPIMDESYFIKLPLVRDNTRW